MACKVEVIEGVVRSHHKKGVIELDEVDYQKIKEAGGNLGVAFSKKINRYYAFVDFYKRSEATGKLEKVRRELLHRFLLGVPGGQDVDHIDRRTLNNRRSNLCPAVKTKKEQDEDS